MRTGIVGTVVRRRALDRDACAADPWIDGRTGQDDTSIEREPARSETRAGPQRPVSLRLSQVSGSIERRRRADVGCRAVVAGPTESVRAQPDRGGTPRPTTTTPSTATSWATRDFVWGPEGWTEARAGLLGPVDGPAGARGGLRRRAGVALAGRARGALAVGARPVGRACSGTPRRWTPATGVRPAAGPGRRRRAAVRRRQRSTSPARPTAPCPFVADPARRAPRGGPGAATGRSVGLLGDAPGALGFPDDPGPDGSHRRATRTSTGRRTSSGTARARRTYVEHHRTLGDQVRALRAAGFLLEDLVEPEWPASNNRRVGGWSPLRGAVIPGTAIFVCRLG